jgi:hypothetical protein
MSVVPETRHGSGGYELVSHRKAACSVWDDVLEFRDGQSGNTAAVSRSFFSCTLLIEFYRAVPWLRRFVAGYSWSPRLNSRPVRVGFVVDEVALG